MTLPLSEPRALVLDLPVPPSANVYWRSLLLPGRGRRTKSNPQGLAAIVVKSEDARAYAVKVKAAFLRQAGFDFEPLTGDLQLDIVWRRERRAGDVSNRIKVVEDSLRELAYADDKQVRRLSIERVDGQTPGLTVTIQELP